MKVTIKQVRKDLQQLLDQNGDNSFPRLKALYLKDIDIVDEEGNAVSPDEVDVEIRLPSDAVMEEGKAVDEEDEEKQEEEEEEDEAKSISASDIAAIVRKELSRNNNKTKAAPPVVKVGYGNSGMTKVGSIKHFKNDESAYRFGRWFAACNGHRKSMIWCKDYNLNIKTHQETVNSSGGYLVPDEFSDQLITLREEFGVIRNNATIVPMSSDVKRIPRRDDTMTAYWVGESASITKSDQTFGQVNLVAKKLAARTKVSNELNEDALINVGDSLAGEMAYAFAKAEDAAGFNGDGTSTYGGVAGIATNLGAGSQQTSSSGAVASMTLGDIHNTMAKLPHYADTPNTKFYMHKQTFNQLCVRLGAGAGGSGLTELLTANTVPSFLGYEVVFCQQMAKTAATFTTGDDVLYFGDLSQAVYLGDRRSTTMAFSDSADSAFEQDEISIRGTERIALVATNLGDASNAGSLVGLISA